MDRFVMRHPDTGGVAPIPASAVDLHRGLGWVRVSDAIPEHSVDQVDLSAYADAAPLDDVDEPAPSAEENSSPEPAPTSTRTSRAREK